MPPPTPTPSPKRSARAVRHRRRTLRVWLLAAVGSLTIGWAVVLAAVALALPWISSHPNEIAAFLSARYGQPVTFTRLSASWQPQGPVFALENLRLGPGEQAFEVPRAQWRLDFYAWLGSQRRFSEFRLTGLALNVERGVSGRWLIRGLTREDAPPIEIDRVLDLTGVVIDNAQVHVRDAELGLDLRMAQVDLAVRERGADQSITLRARVDGRSGTLRAVCERTVGERALDCFARGRGLDAARWLAGVPLAGAKVTHGAADVRAWLTFDADQVQRARLLLDASRLSLAALAAVEVSDQRAPYAFSATPQWQVDVSFARSARGFAVDLGESGFGAGGGSVLRWQRVSAGDGAGDVSDTIDAARVDLSSLSALAAVSDLAPRLRGALVEGSPRGELREVQLRRVGDALWSQGQMRGLALDDGARSPGIANLHGAWLADADGVVLTPELGSTFTFDFPHMFREPIRARIDGGALAAWRDPDQRWYLGADALALTGDGFVGSVAAAVRLPQVPAPGYMTLRVAVSAAKVARARAFWPVNVMPPATVRWLDRGLVEGEVDRGWATFQGPLVAGALKRGEAVLDARAEVSAVTVDYGVGWPQASIAAASLHFDARSIRAEVGAGRVLDNVVRSGQVTIDDLSNPRLVLTLKADGGGDELLAFVRQSPLKAPIGTYLEGLSIGGRGELALAIDWPLRRGAGPPQIDGHVDLRDATLIDRERELDFGRTQGRVRFSRSGMISDDLSVRFGGEPATLALAIGEFVAEPRNVLEASLRGEFGAQALLTRFAAAAPWIDRMPGRADFDIQLAIARAAPGQRADAAAPAAEKPVAQRSAQPAARLTLRSDLDGIQLDFPAPLRKSPASALPLELELPLGADAGPAQFTLGRVVRGQLRLPQADQTLALALGFGVAEVPALPNAGLRARGDVLALDLGGWGNLVADLPQREAPEAADAFDLDVDLLAAELALIGRAFPDTRVQMSRADSAATPRLTFDGEAIVGAVDLPRTDAATRTLSAEFAKLYLLAPVPGTRAKPVDPAGLPALKIHAADFRLGEAQLGDLRLATQPTAGGLAVTELKAVSPQMQLTGSGSWLGAGPTERSDFKLAMQADDLGKMLGALGYAGVISGGRTEAQLAGNWRGGPADFKLAELNGSLSAQVEGGRILDVEPGAGRVLGLISVLEIPRRLTLDFSDFFSKGMAFDSIRGEFRLAAGDAYTDGVTIASPAADIVVSGRTGLAARDYDQILIVTPRLGGVLPLVGALTGGPAGAAVGAVAQGVLGGGIGRMAQSKYQVTGGWDQPEVTPQRASPPRS